MIRGRGFMKLKLKFCEHSVLKFLKDDKAKAKMRNQKGFEPIVRLPI